MSDLDLGYLLVMAGRAVQEATERASAALDISATDLNALYELEVHGPLLSGAFAQLLVVQQPTVTAIADRLEGAGLLQRRRDEDDRRRVWLSSTCQGRLVIDGAYSTVAAQVEHLFSPLSPGAYSALKALLAEVVTPWLEQRVRREQRLTPVVSSRIAP